MVKYPRVKMYNFIQKRANDTFFLHLRVKPNSNKQEIIVDKDFLTIFIRSKAIQNRANKELFNLLKKKLKVSSNQIQIISGIKSTNKTIKLILTEEFDEQEIIKRLSR